VIAMSQHKTTKTKLGSTGPDVFPIALGCMGMSGMYGQSTEAEGIATIQAAIDRGVTLIDTGDFYGMGDNELLIQRGIENRRDKVQLSVKFGVMRGPDGSWLGTDTRPVAVKNFIAYSLKRLGVDVIDIYRPARLDPTVPIEDTIGAIAELVKQGYVRHIGLSEVGVDTIRRAHAVHPIVDLQIEYSIVTRTPEAKIFPTLEELGISATLYGILSRGLLSGSKPGAPSDLRRFLPRFSVENQANNDKVVSDLRTFAESHGRTPAEVAIGWALAKQPRLVPVVGARTRAQLEGIFNVLEKPMSSAELAELEALIPRDAIAGARYQAAHMAHLDSER
jgi:aryl-alcohol dehydrogenase-like predicted oxidoreductase